MYQDTGYKQLSKNSVDEKGKKSSLSRNTCKYHNLDHCIQGKIIPSLEQEAIQNYKKHYRIRFDSKSTVDLRGKNKMFNPERDENGRMRNVNFNNQNKSW